MPVPLVLYSTHLVIPTGQADRPLAAGEAEGSHRGVRTLEEGAHGCLVVWTVLRRAPR